MCWWIITAKGDPSSVSSRPETHAEVQSNARELHAQGFKKIKHRIARSILLQPCRLPAVQPVPPSPLLPIISEAHQRVIPWYLQREGLLLHEHSRISKGQLFASDDDVKRDDLLTEKLVRRAETTVMERAMKSTGGTKSAMKGAMQSAMHSPAGDSRSKAHRPKCTKHSS